MNRQFLIMEDDIFKGSEYIYNYSDMSLFYLEVSADILYVIFNLLLAIKITESLNIEDYNGDIEKYQNALYSVIKTHYDEYNIYYNCKDALMTHRILNYVSGRKLLL